MGNHARCVNADCPAAQPSADDGKLPNVQYSPGLSFCQECGGPLEKALAEMKGCEARRDGRPCLEGKFCGYCGRDMAETSADPNA